MRFIPLAEWFRVSQQRNLINHPLDVHEWEIYRLLFPSRGDVYHLSWKKELFRRNKILPRVERRTAETSPGIFIRSPGLISEKAQLPLPLLFHRYVGITLAFLSILFLSQNFQHGSSDWLLIRYRGAIRRLPRTGSGDFRNRAALIAA